MTGTQLYNSESILIYPNTKMEYVLAGVFVAGEEVTLRDDLRAALSRIMAVELLAATAINAATGGVAVLGSLFVEASYKLGNTPTKDDIIQSSGTWEGDPPLPTSAQQYCWKKTEYKWKVDNLYTPLLTTYEVIATALQAETLVMYCAFSPNGNITGEGLGGPREYSTSTLGVQDKYLTAVMWYYFFPGISASSTLGFMAIRHRDPGQAFSEWKINLMAQYPVTNS